MPAYATTDLCDAHQERIDAGEIAVVETALLAFGRRTAFHGEAVTLKVFEDNSRVADAVRSEGRQRVLVIDGGGSRRVALLGGNLADAAAKNGWAGVLVDGAVRDVDEIDRLELGVRALAVSPRRCVKRNAGERDLVISAFGVCVRPGSWIYVDRDGVVVAPHALHPAG
ncbi:MAG TPA: ribonuclease E activity regulator RraA [Burkholderiaceae bacterium]|nr:ribonuclease E activity regulator RraA [Burkholderiaceae bacterium]